MHGVCVWYSGGGLGRMASGRIKPIEAMVVYEAGFICHCAPTIHLYNV